MGVGSNPTAFKRDSAMGLFLYAERKVEWAEEAEAVEKGVEALEPEKVNLQFPRLCQKCTIMLQLKEIVQPMHGKVREIRA